MATQPSVQIRYPAFSEGKHRLCRRVNQINSKEILCQSEKKPRTLLKKAQEQSRNSNIKSGDWVGLVLDAKGRVREIQLLAPALTQFEEPRVKLEALQEWNLFLKTVRRFFEDRGFLEVQTPTLVTCPGTEPFLDVFETEFRQGQRRQKYFLPTSPELHLKKMVAQGYGSVFEMRPCFRNGEISEHHQPEFWMLEWYRPGHDLTTIQKDCRDLVKACARALKKAAPKSEKDFSMRELFRKKLKFDLTPQTTAEELAAKSRELHLQMPANSDFDDAFYFLFLEKIERDLPKDALVFVKNYPPSQAALARLTSEGWGDRFEMYWKGMELANAYHELNDPDIQRQRSQEDLKKRDQRGAQKLNLDEEFFKALDAGMPPTAGIALGLERLFLALTDRKDLREIRVFPME